MTRPRPRVPRLPGVTVLARVSLVALLVIAMPAAAQTTPFRVVHQVEKGPQPQVTINGRVYNDARADAIDVYVTAEALDSAGKVVASGVSYVGSVPAGSSTAFVVKVPSARPAASYRVLVTSHKFGFANQS